MTPSILREKVISERIKWIKQMMSELRSLPFETYERFSSERRNIAAAESYLRRALEALLDLGRHILAKGFGRAVAEYKEIAGELHRTGVMTAEDSEKLRILAGYRNRMVHFYHEISEREIYQICTRDLGDIETVLDSLLKWIKDHPEKVDKKL